MKKLLMTLFLFVSTVALGQESLPSEVFVPIDQVVDATLNLVKDGKGMSKLVLSMGVLNLLVMLLRTAMLSAYFDKKSPGVKRFIILVLGQILGILSAVEGGLSPLSAIIGGLITSGGAVALFEAYKPLMKKKEENNSTPVG